MLLHRIQGPECPGCGCQQSELLGTATRTLTKAGLAVSQETIERRRCEFCDRRFYVTAPAVPQNVVVVTPIACPHCRSTETRVTSTRKTERYHRCDACAQSFRSIEQK